MKTTVIITAAAAAALLSACANAAQQTTGAAHPAASSNMTEADAKAPPSGRAFIPFADFRGTIRNWSEDQGSLYIETGGDHWYRAEMFSPCTSLPFATSIGFVTDPLGQIDKFSSIITDEGERCWFKSFEELASEPDLKGDMHPTG